MVSIFWLLQSRARDKLSITHLQIPKRKEEFLFLVSITQHSLSSSKDFVIGSFREMNCDQNSSILAFLFYIPLNNFFPLSICMPHHVSLSYLLDARPYSSLIPGQRLAIFITPNLCSDLLRDTRGRPDPDHVQVQLRSSDNKQRK